ncbi:hypothetical protein D3C81_1300450 [compost metagenome]
MQVRHALVEFAQVALHQHRQEHVAILFQLADDLRQGALERACLQHLALRAQTGQQQSIVPLELPRQYAQAGLAYGIGRNVVQGVVEGVGVGQHDHLAAQFGGEVQAVVGIQLAHRLGVDAQTVLEQANEALCQLALLQAIQVPDQVQVRFLVQVHFLEVDRAHRDGAMHAGGVVAAGGEQPGGNRQPLHGQATTGGGRVCAKSVTTHQLSCADLRSKSAIRHYGRKPNDPD